MLRFRTLDRGTRLLMLGVAIFVVGCSGTGPADKSGSSGSRGAAAGDGLTDKIGEYMPPLDRGRLEIAAPKGWNWANPGGGVLVAFKPADAELNALPRVLLSVEDSPFPGIDDVTAANVETFVGLVADALADTKPKEPVRATTLGGQPFARYLLLGKRRGQVVVQQIVKTVVGGRAYTLQLEVYQPQFERHKIALSVIAASMKFPARDGETATDPPDSAPPGLDAGDSKEDSAPPAPDAGAGKEAADPPAAEPES
jgi:hypothetical protein